MLYGLWLIDMQIFDGRNASRVSHAVHISFSFFVDMIKLVLKAGWLGGGTVEIFIIQDGKEVNEL